MNHLDKILRYKKEELEVSRRRRRLVDLKAMVRDAEPPRPFLENFLAAPPTRIIAELKRASPSAGLIRKDFSVPILAEAYAQGGAAALSVLTDQQFFQGTLDDIIAAKRAGPLPVLRKDFTLHEYHLWEARAHGADAVLLIVACLEDNALRDYQALARDLGMDALVEVHAALELERAAAARVPFLGINNRDLATLRVDLDTTCRLMEKVPEGVTVISESGIGSRDVIEDLERRGVVGFLIGETLLKAEDPVDKLRELRGKN